MKQPGYRIGQLAETAGVHVETIRYYQRRGLIAQPAKPGQGYRLYPHTTLARLLFIKRAQTLGFSLQEIAQLLQLGDAPCHDVQQMAAQKVTSVRAKIADLKRLESVLGDLLAQCASNSDHHHCPIIDVLQPEEQ